MENGRRSFLRSGGRDDYWRSRPGLRRTFVVVVHPLAPIPRPIGAAPQEPQIPAVGLFVVGVELNGVNLLARHAMNELTLLRRQNEANRFSIRHTHSS